ncbi:GAF domain-containing protein [Variovorax sp. RHLX14]|uniref:GAF domain-containing protein n=1 Tax=Variovorax sp. RHLX14 TaxID=1259731 RepID=UPI003F4790A1
MSKRSQPDAVRTLALLSDATRRLAEARDLPGLYRAVEAALGELVGFRLFTLLRVTPMRDGLERMHSSDLRTYPAGGVKPVADDPWLQRLLVDNRPSLSPDAHAVRQNFPDAEAIFALGCESALNVPILFQGRILGSMNLLHAAHWFRPSDAALCQPFAALLGAAFYFSSGVSS